MKKKFKLLIITPIIHIESVYDKLNNYFEITYEKDISEKKLLKIIHKFDAIFTNPNQSKIYLGNKLLNKAQNLKVIATASTGTNHIDKINLKNKKIKLISLTKELNLIKKITSTAELSLTLTLMAIRNVIESNNNQKKGIWKYTPFIGNEFSSLNVLVIGYGRLGKIYAKLCIAIGFNVYVYDPYININNKKIKVVKNLFKILNKINIISLHIHASDKNKNFINKKFLSNVKQDCILINTSRGDIVSDKDLIYFLRKNKTAKYYTDVLNKEYLGPKKNIIHKYSKITHQIFITSHIGGMTTQGQYKAYNHIAKLLIEYFKKLN